MSNEEGTLIDGAGESSQPAISGDGDLVSTTEFMASPADDAGNSSTADANAEGTPGADGKPQNEGEGNGEGDGKVALEKDAGTQDGTGTGEGDDRFDKHPRFVELNERTKAAEIRAANAEAEVKALGDKFNASSQGKEGEELPYKDITKMTDEEIQEWQDNDPKGFHANTLAQAKYELSQDFNADMSNRTIEGAISKTYDDYAKENPDFDKMWDSGELKIFMDKNPGHNAISAHIMLTAQAKQQDAIDTAVKASEKKFRANLKAKGKSSVLGSGPGSSARTVSETAPELKDTKKHGGLNAVLAERSLARDRARTG